MKRTPRYWFLALIGPAFSEAELLAILRLLDLSVRPRTMPENHEVAVEEDEDADGDDDDDREAEDDEKFIIISIDE